MQKQINSFFDLLASFQEELKKYGIEISSYSELSKKMFCALPTVYQTFLMKKIIDQMAVLKSPHLIYQTGPENFKANLCEGLIKMGITVNDKNYNSLFVESKDAVQVLDTSGMMIFCNWNFLVRTGYDLLILNLFSYQELFERSNKFGKILEAKINEVFKTDTITYGLTLHTMKTHLYPYKKLLLCNLKQFVPVVSYNQNKKYVMIISDIKNMGDSKEQIEFLKLSV